MLWAHITSEFTPRSLPQDDAEHVMYVHAAMVATELSMLCGMCIPL